MLELEQAQARILALVNPLPSETVPLLDAVGRFVSAALSAPLDLPPFDNSAMDGYALRAEDVKGATRQTPIPLRLVGQSVAGSGFADRISSGECVRIFTGSPLPQGADAVIMQEDTQPGPDAANRNAPLMLDTVKPWENVRLRGEDVKKGAPLIGPGERLGIGHLGLLAALGFANVPVGRRPVVGLLATGSELVEAGHELKPGQIYESNRLSLALLASSVAADTKVYPLVPDQLSATQSALTDALTECDAVVTSGGVSVGEMDFVKAAFEQLGGSLEFWRVAIKPGKPFVFGNMDGKLLFGLPGNPVSAFVTFLLLVRPALLRLQGASHVHLSVRTGILEQPLVNPGDRRHFMRVSLDDQGRLRPSGPQASHRLLSLANANGLVDVPPNATLAAGSVVSVLLWP